MPDIDYTKNLRSTFVIYRLNYMLKVIKTKNLWKLVPEFDFAGQAVLVVLRKFCCNILPEIRL